MNSKAELKSEKQAIVKLKAVIENVQRNSVTQGETAQNLEKKVDAFKPNYRDDSLASRLHDTIDDRNKAQEELKSIRFEPILETYLLSNEPQDLAKTDGRLRREVGNYFLNHNILHKKQPTKVSSLRKNEEVIVIPRALVKRVLHMMHNNPLAGHGATQRILFRTKRLFTWLGTDKDVKKYVASCIVCQNFKGNAHPLCFLARLPIPSCKFQSIAVDLIGPLPVTERGNKYILICVDYLTRYTIIATLKRIEAKEVASAIWDNIISQWGPPETILSDNGTEFRNAVMKKLAKLGGFDDRTVTIYHPGSNRLVENHNKLIISILRSIVDSLHPIDWDGHLATAQFALNSAYNSSIGDTPYYAVYGMDPIFPNAALPNFSSPYNVDERASATHRIYHQVKENLERAADQREKQRSKIAKKTDLLSGQRVYVMRPKKKWDTKFTPKWRGPYRILEKLRTNVYRLEELGTKKTTEVHLELIKIVPESVISRQLAPSARRPYYDVLNEKPKVDSTLAYTYDSDDGDDNVDNPTDFCNNESTTDAADDETSLPNVVEGNEQDTSVCSDSINGNTTQTNQLDITSEDTNPLSVQLDANTSVNEENDVELSPPNGNDNEFVYHRRSRDYRVS
ncbi:uncharacterized protein LOC122248828 [Penaeus japonicus]|uniref:uncharacterized protein LOC122248828 n=1 Tax=Penaeus japonicus TaxID=27405 RepID=UPI001C70C513|nr:uncharacterized protein LOC122248828 [Penaeus japonicus]